MPKTRYISPSKSISKTSSSYQALLAAKRICPINFLYSYLKNYLFNHVWLGYCIGKPKQLKTKQGAASKFRCPYNIRPSELYVLNSEFIQFCCNCLFVCLLVYKDCILCTVIFPRRCVEWLKNCHLTALFLIFLNKMIWVETVQAVNWGATLESGEKENKIALQELIYPINP